MFISLNKIFALYGCISHSLLFFYFTFKVITTISESSYGIHVKRIFSHANCVCFYFTGWVMDFFINSLTIILDLLFKTLLILLSTLFFNVFFLAEFLFNLKVLTLIERKNFSFPFPLKISFTVWFRRIIKQTSRTDSVINNCNRLKSVCQNNVWIHGCNVQMVNQWFSFVFGRIFNIPEFLERNFKFLWNFIIITNIIKTHIRHFDLEWKFNDFVDVTNEVIKSLGTESKLSGELSTINTSS